MDKDFRFRFESILTYREKQEEEARKRMGAAVTALEQAKMMLQQYTDCHIGAISQWKASLKKQQRILDMQSRSNQIQWFHEKVCRQQGVVKNAEKQVEKCRLMLVEAKREKKKFEKIKENDYEAFKTGEKKREAIYVDQFVSHRTAMK